MVTVKEQKVIDGGKKIARFMDMVQFYDDNNHLCLVEHYPDRLKYHLSWSWLIPVIEKIAETKYPFNLYFSHIQNTATVYDVKERHYIIREGETQRMKPAILTAFTAVVEFIDYYNEKLKKNEPTKSN